MKIDENILNGETLCKECGLCCEGVFHTYAHLHNKNDIFIAKKANIIIKHNEVANIDFFSLPCSGFNKICTIYPERPSVCGKHKCELLKNLIDKQCTLGDALNTVDKLKNILIPLLPTLQELAKNDQTNNPKALMESIDPHINNKEFKKSHTKLFIDFGIFCFLVEKYFYTDTNTY